MRLQFPQRIRIAIDFEQSRATDCGQQLGGRDESYVCALFIKDSAVAIRLFKPQLLVDYLILWRDGEERSRLTEEFAVHVQVTANALVRKVSQYAERAAR